MTGSGDLDSVLSPAARPEDSALDHSLRPRTLDEFIGQEKLKANLRVFLAAAKARKEHLDH